MMDLGDIREHFRDDKVRRVKLGGFDIDGGLRGKYVSVDRFWASSESTVGFSDVLFGWDIAGGLYDNVKFTGRHTGYPDVACRVDLETYRTIPWEPGTALFLLDFETKDGQPLPIAPRQMLRRVLQRAEESGYHALFSAEYEFAIFRETSQSLREKHFHDPAPLTAGMSGYNLLGASSNTELVRQLDEQLAAYGVPLEDFHTEAGPGAFGGAIAADNGLRAADRAALFKTAVKEIVSRQGLMATFMARWNRELAGSSAHLRQSLWDKDRKQNLFDDGGMSGLMRSYIAGLLANMPEMMALFCPTVNSYKRAPVHATWGVDNRNAAVRAIPGGGKGTHVELRLTGADINPYIAMAAALAAGLDGIERNMQLEESEAGEVLPLPRTLADATRRLRESERARCWLGEEFIDHYACTREWEVRQFDKAVTDWELARYFEAI